MLILNQDNYTDYFLCYRCLLWRNVVRYNVKLKKVLPTDVFTPVRWGQVTLVKRVLPLTHGF